MLTAEQARIAKHKLVKERKDTIKIVAFAGNFYFNQLEVIFLRTVFIIKYAINLKTMQGLDTVESLSAGATASKIG